MPLNFRKKVVWANVESAYRTNPGLAAATDGIEVRNFSLTVKNKTVDQNTEQAFLGAVRKLVVGTAIEVKFDVAIAGSGTAGVAPAWGRLLRACKRSEKVLAAADIGTAQAGSTTTIQLAATASAVNDYYTNMEVNATGGAGSGQSGIVKSYDGVTKTATLFEAVAVAFSNTTTYSFDPQTSYSPVDEGDDSEYLIVYLDKLKFLVEGARGSIVRSLEPLKVPVFTITYTGLWGGYSDVSAMPTNTVVTAWKTPQSVNAAHTTGFKLHGFATNLYTYSVDDGSQVVHRDDIVGVEDVQITDRDVKGSVEIQHPLKAEYDFYAAANGENNNSLPVEGPMAITHGTVAGSIVKFYEPAVTVADPSMGNRNGVTSLKLTLSCKPVAPGGNDSIIIVK